MVNTTVYMIRHSLKFSSSNIETYNTTQNDVLKSEKVVLSVEGEERAKALGNLDIFNNIDVIYASNCVRTLETAKYLLSRLNLKVNLDERFDERRFGIPNSDKYPDWFRMQYFDQTFKTEGGESQEDVRNRVNEAFNEVVNNNRGKKIAIFSHGYAITFFLMKWVKLLELTEDRKFTFEFNGKVFYNKKLDAPEIFKLTINENNELIDIEYIPFLNE